MKRILISLAWTALVLFFFFVMIHVLVIAGFIAYNLSKSAAEMSSAPFPPLLVVLLVLAFVFPLVMGAGTFLLGLNGKLPGTRAS